MTTLAAIRVRNGEIIDRAGHADKVTITPIDGGFTLHGASGPPPEGWAQSPDDAPVGWEQTESGINIWSADDDVTIRFVPEGEFPDPDWSRVSTVAQAKSRRTVLSRTAPDKLALLVDKVADLEARIAMLENVRQ